MKSRSSIHPSGKTRAYKICVYRLLFRDNFLLSTQRFGYFRHTHEAVDQLFSRISFELLIKHDETTMSAFIYHLQNSFYPTPNVEELVFVIDFREWLDPFLHLQFKTMTGPHRFIFHQDGSNPLGRMWTREWSDPRTLIRGPSSLVSQLDPPAFCPLDP